MPTAFRHSANLTPEEAHLLCVKAEEQAEAMKALDYPAPWGYGIHDFWVALEHGGYSTQPAKASTGQELRNTIMAFLSDEDDRLSFNPKYIQVRYNVLIVKIKLQNLVELTDLEFFFSKAMDEYRAAATYGEAGPWSARLKCIEYWHASSDDFPVLSDFEIMVFARKLFRMYLSMLEVEQRISEAMDTGVVTEDDQKLIQIRLNIKGLENLLGAYVGLCQQYQQAGPQVLKEAASQAEDPLAKYKEDKYAPEAEESDDESDISGSIETGETAATSVDGNPESEGEKLERLMLDAFETMDLYIRPPPSRRPTTPRSRMWSTRSRQLWVAG
jgi:hypothetical protein